MKKSATILICSLLLVLSGCATQQNNSLSDISSSETTDMEQTEAQESTEEQQTSAATTQTTTSATSQQTSASTTAQTTASTTAPTETEPDLPETWEYYTSDAYTEESYVEAPAEDDIYEPVIDVPVYSDSNLGDYVLLTVVPEKIYWNELDYFHPTEGEEFTMLFPSFFYETFKESDSVVLRFDPFESGSSQRKESLKSQCGGCDFVYSYVRPSDSWQKDMLFSIKDGELTKLDCEKYIKTYYNDYEAESWVMSDHKDEFYYGMTVEEVDAFMADQHAECVEADEYWNKVIEEDPNNAVDFEMSHSYFTWGMVMRVKLADAEASDETLETPNDESEHEPPVFVFDNYDRNHLLVTIVPEKIYWQDEAHNFTVGKACDILIPEVIYDTISSADSMMIYLDEYNSFPYKQQDYSFSPVTENAQGAEYDNVFADYYWNEEHLLIIKDGILSKLPITDEIREYFDANITDSSLMCMFPDEFYDGMSAQSADEFLTEQHRIVSDNTDEYEYETIEPSATAGYFMTGTQMRVKLAEDGSTSATQTNKTAVYDDVFEEIDETTSSGPRPTYEEDIEMLSETVYGGIDSFYLVETVKALTLSECEQLRGWDEWFESCYALSYDEIKNDDRNYFGDKTIYEVIVIEDLISGEESDRKMYLSVGMGGNPRIQRAGDPIYAPGERFTVAVHQKPDDSDITRSCGGFMFRYDAVEDASGNITLYSRNSAMDDLNLTNAVAIEKTVITSTTKNPAHYTCKIPLDDLAAFLRQDWEKRKISRHFTTAVTTDSEVLPHPEIPADVIRYVHKTTYGDFYYFAADIVIDKIYYNDLPHVKPTVGDTVKIIFPCERYADITETDQIILNFDGTENTNGFWGAERDGLFFDTPVDYYYAYHSWDADSIFFIEADKLSALSMSEDDCYSFLVAEHYKKFYYGMTAEAVDEFIMEQRADDLAEKDFVPPDGMEIEYGISAFMFVDGLRIKGHIENIYANS